MNSVDWPKYDSRVIRSRFLELVEQNQDIVQKICGLYAGNMDDRKDLSQEIICQLWTSYQSFRGEAKFTTWMYKVALNTALLNLRRYRRRVRTKGLNEHHANIPAEVADQEKHPIYLRNTTTEYMMVVVSSTRT